MKNIQPFHFLLGGAGLAALGVFLPWMSLSIDPMLTAITGGSFSGLRDWRGTLTLLTALAAGASWFVKVPGKEKLIATVGLACAGAAALFALIALIDHLTASSMISPGFGIFISILGAAAAGWGAFNIWKKIPNPPAGGSPPSSGPPPPPGPPPA